MRTVLTLGLIAALSSLTFAGNEDASPHTAFPSPRYSGLGRVPFTSNNVQLRGWLTLGDFPGGNVSGNDCWGYTSPSGREYAIIGLSDGTGFVEVTDPGNPTIVGFIAGPSSLWRCIKVYQAFAYAGSEGIPGPGGNVQIFNLTNIDSGSVTLVGTVGGTCSAATHTLAVDTTSGFLYRAGGGSTCGGVPQGLQIYNLANPAAPVLAGQWNTGRYVHECQVETWTVPGPYLGKQIAFCYTEDTSGGNNPRLQILDVTNKGAIAILSTTSYTGSRFSHQGWTSADKQYLYLDDELDETIGFGGSRTRLFSIADLAAPSYLGFFYAGAPSIDHNLYTVGNRLFEGNYRSGLRVFDNTVPTAPTLIGFFDTFPEDDLPEFNGLWSNYPFFASGTIIGGDIEKGLFVWRIETPKLTFSFPEGNPELVGPTGSVIHFEIDQALAGDLQGGTEQFHYSTGGGAFTTVTPVWLGGNRYEATLPSISCGRQVQYYVSAKSNDGQTWTDPPAGPTQVYQANAATSQIPVFAETFEAANPNWQVNVAADLIGFSTATTGAWARGNPIGTAAQPEDDHSSPGTNCWFTGQGSVGGAVGEADVDGGATSLRSAVLNASGLSDPHITYWRWYSNVQGDNAATNTMTVDISSNGGTSWLPVETLGPVGIDSEGGWIQKDVRIADFVAPTNNMRLRFRVSDLNGAVIEAAIDDLKIVDYQCSTLTVASISQSSGPFNGGNVVTLTGTNFVVGQTTVRFGFNDSPSVTVLSPTSLQAVVPHAPSANFNKFRPAAVMVDVIVQNPGTGTLPGAYTYQPPPQKTL